MSSINTEFTNSKGHQLEAHREIPKVDSRHFLREAHGIQEGIRKDKKIKMDKKLK